MVTTIGNDIIIKIDGTDYTEYILNYSETGGEKQIQHIKTIGNDTKSIITGRENYSLELTFKYDETNLNFDTLFESDDSVTIEIIMNSKTITYSNAYPVNAIFNLVNNEIVNLTISYSCPSATSNVYNKEVL